MPDETTPNQAGPAAPGASPQGTPTAEGGVPQNQDKTDAMTYPLGSQNTSAESGNKPEEDHRSILDRIMGLFNKGQASETPPSEKDQAPENTTPPPGK